MAAMAQKLGQAEPQRAKLASENAKLQRSITRLEREMNQARTAAEDLKSKLDGTEDSLNQALTELATSKAESKSAYQQGYNEGINTATENYKAQMPTIQDEVWATTWAACLKKAGVPETSSLWAENNLPSTVAMPEEDFAEEEDSLNEELNAGHPVQSADDVVQEGENVPTPAERKPVVETMLTALLRRSTLSRPLLHLFKT